MEYEYYIEIVEKKLGTKKGEKVTKIADRTIGRFNNRKDAEDLYNSTEISDEITDVKLWRKTKGDSQKKLRHKDKIDNI